MAIKVFYTGREIGNELKTANRIPKRAKIKTYKVTKSDFNKYFKV